MEEGERAMAARRRGGAVRAEEVVLLPTRPLHRAPGRLFHAPQRPDDCKFSGKCRMYVHRIIRMSLISHLVIWSTFPTISSLIQIQDY